MSRIVFIAVMAVVYPLSLLPFRILYILSDILYYLNFYLIGYRKKVVFSNLRNAFPEKPAKEIDRIAKKFYLNLADLIVENIKMAGISKDEVSKRCVFQNPELFNRYQQQGRSVITTMGHCGNWELAGLSASLTLMHHCIVFYRKLKNIHFDNFAKEMRGKFGMELLPHTHAFKMLKQEGKQPNMYIFITDQTPSNSQTSYWTTFLNQDTAIFRGTEKTARITGHPVFFCDIQRVKRGYYTIEVSLLCENPSSFQEGEITELHTRALERAIINNPDNWLWSHRRWKRKR